MDELFTDDAVVRRVWREPHVIWGGGRALLLQLAHPDVAAGVAEHSRWRDDPTARLRHTLEATSAVVFGEVSEGRAAVASMRAVHDRVRGRGYAATEPSLQMWVHATVVDTALVMYQRFLRPLAVEEVEQYHRECVVVGEALGIPRWAQPADARGFRAYWRHMVRSLRVTDVARELARAVLHPPLGWSAEPWLVLGRQLTVGLLPEPVRRQYGLGWDVSRQALLTATEVASRQVLPLLPMRMRRVPGMLVAS